MLQQILTEIMAGKLIHNFNKSGVRNVGYKTALINSGGIDTLMKLQPASGQSADSPSSRNFL